jgi:hypothetical protein
LNLFASPIIHRAAAISNSLTASRFGRTIETNHLAHRTNASPSMHRAAENRNLNTPRVARALQTNVFANFAHRSNASNSSNSSHPYDTASTGSYRVSYTDESALNETNRTSSRYSRIEISSSNSSQHSTLSARAPYAIKRNRVNSSDSMTDSSSSNYSRTASGSSSINSSQYSTLSTRLPNAIKSNRVISSYSMTDSSSSNYSRSGSSSINSSQYSTKTPNAKKRNIDSSQNSTNESKELTNEKSLSKSRLNLINQNQLHPSTSKSAQTKANISLQPSLNSLSQSLVRQQTKQKENVEALSQARALISQASASFLKELSSNKPKETQVAQKSQQKAMPTHARSSRGINDEIESCQRPVTTTNDEVRDLCKSLSNSSIVENCHLLSNDFANQSRFLDPNEVEGYFNKISRSQRASTPNDER